MKKNRDVALLSPGSGAGGIQFFLQWFAEAWSLAGGKIKDRSVIWPHFSRVLLGRNWPGICFSRRNRLLVLGSGRIESVAWPSMLFNEIVPVLWDVWPDKVAPLCRFVRRHRVKILFCTSSYAVEKLRAQLPNVDIFWIPEGIKIDEYPKGEVLQKRMIDILSYGRQMDNVMSELDLLSVKNHYNMWSPQRGKRFPDFKSLIVGLQSSKLTVCYPQSMTHPERAIGTETLTQRYWECMLTGTLLIGHAPAELIEVCGYNPVIELGDNPVTVVRDVLMHIEDYQELADKNRKCAEEKAGWDKRMPEIMEILK